MKTSEIYKLKTDNGDEILIEEYNENNTTFLMSIDNDYHLTIEEMTALHEMIGKQIKKVKK